MASLPDTPAILSPPRPHRTLFYAAELIRERGVARGAYLNGAGQLDAAGAIYAAAGVHPLAGESFAQVGAGFHPHYAAGSQRPAVASAWSALRALAAWIDPATVPKEDGEDGVTYDAIERLVATWSDTGTASEVADGLVLAAAKLLERQ